ncbi:MAG: chorismate synthase [Deltaproteobacteria bacterium]|nr:chorismate synthase [Deltaproteobacteria bacterium]
MANLRYLTSGESHGPALTVILEGMPAGVPVSSEKINIQLWRRQQGYGRGGRMSIEKDEVQILSGIRFGQTLGSPITLQVHNKDWVSWQEEMAIEGKFGKLKRVVTKPRPGHADLVGGMKYNHRDLRNILERASARETTVRVACGALVRQLLEALGVPLTSYVKSIGRVKVSAEPPAFDKLVARCEKSPVRTFDAKAELAMIKIIDQARKSGNSLGGVIEVLAFNLPPGLGSYVQWDRKLDGKLAQALMSIQAIKGVEIGLGFEAARLLGSEVHDSLYYNSKEKKYVRKSNGAGGLEGSMTNGEPLVLRAAMKPISTLYKPLDSVDIESKQAYKASIERSDVCAVPAAAVIAENVVAITLADAFLEKFGGDSLLELKKNLKGYLKQVQNF